MNSKTIAIAGLGLMGGSLAAACRKKFPHARILGISRKKSALSYARRKGWIHYGSMDLADAVCSDLVVLCTPVDVLFSQLCVLEKSARNKLLVTDVGSVKGDIVRRADAKKWKYVCYVGAHPMVGSQLQGIEAAHDDLYDTGLVFVTPGKETNRSALKSVTSFWKTLAAKVIAIAPDKHDHVASQISHLPHALAFMLMRAVDKENLFFSAGSFRDMTRIASSHSSIWAPIFLTNQKALLKDLKRYQKELQDFQKALQARDLEGICKIVSSASSRRSKI